MAALELWAATLSGSLATVVGLAGVVAFVVVFAALTGRAAVRRRLVWGVAATGLAAALGVVVLQATRAPSPNANPLLQRMALVEATRSYRAREPAWRAGIAAVAERPWIGWGRENFIVAFGRHAPAPAADGHAFDRAHSELVERAVTEGVPGAIWYLALWALAFAVVVRVAKRQSDESGERTLALFVGGALTGYLLASQLHVVGTAALDLQLALLFAYVVGLEVACRRTQARPCGAMGGALLRLRKVFAAACGLGAAAIAVASLTANHAIYRAATAFSETPPGRTDYVERTIGAFPPLAGEPRRRLFNWMANEWGHIRAANEAIGRWRCWRSPMSMRERRSPRNRRTGACGGTLPGCTVRWRLQNPPMARWRPGTSAGRGIWHRTCSGVC